ASTVHDGAIELGTSAGSYTRTKQSETLDSGIESEHRENVLDSVSTASDGKENEPVPDGKENEPIHIESMNTDSIEKAVDAKEELKSTAPPHDTEHIIKPVEHPRYFNVKELTPEPEVETQPPEAIREVLDQSHDDIFSNGEHEEQDVDVLIRARDLEYRADPNIGTSLHDELFHADVAPSSNSLLNRSWKKPKTSLVVFSA
ncbi:unnamed protein product, partial [Cylicostephanus goldi]